MTRYAGTVTVESQGTRTLVEWERPPLNIFTGRLLRELERSLRGPDVLSANVVVLRGRGRGWSAGFDIGEHLAPALPSMLASFEGALRALWDVPVPTVAEIHGSCLGGGLELAMACDLAYAADNSTFGQPEIRLGVFPPFAAAWYGEAVGPRRAAELAFLGETFDARHAVSLGLVNAVRPDAELAGTVDKVAQYLQATRREGLVHLKRALRSSAPEPWPALSRADRIYQEDLMAGADAEEGLKAFLEKRTPRWPTPAVRARGASP